MNGAWAKDLGIVAATTTTENDPKGGNGTNNPITVLSDGDADLVRQLGLVEDMGYGIGVRSKRFVIILEDGEVQRVEVDEGMDVCDKTRPENIVRILTPEGTSSVEGSDVNMGALVGVGAVILAGLAYSMSGDGGASSSSVASDGFNLLQQFGN